MPSSSSASASQLSESTIRAAQQALNDKGYDARPIDGVWGPHTQDAVRKFQKAQGLTESGNLDHSTLAALGVSQQGSTTASNRTTTSGRSTTTGSGSQSSSGASEASQPHTD